MNKFRNRIGLILICSVLIGGVFANQGVMSYLTGIFGNATASPAPSIVSATGTIEVAFSPNNGATDTVIRAISEAKQIILVSAYSFTSKDIAKALLDAKKRGVEVKIILDKSQVSQQYSSSTFFANQGFDLKIDVKHAIYHDKVMLIDHITLITGSFNFTKAAQEKNAENVLVMRDNPALVKLYEQDWLANWNMAVPVSEYASYKQSRSKRSKKTKVLDDDE